jgi:pimeloyl-ACP methyl ester carboxylesterase
MNRTKSALVLSVVPPLGWAVVAGLWMPRGPLTTIQGLATVALSLLVGLAAGYLAGSRWAMLVAPVIFVVVFEALRAPLDGPTVDGIHLSMYGLIAFAVGRFFHGLLALLPMVLGAAYGAGLARWRAQSLGESHPDAHPMRRRIDMVLRRIVAATAALALIGLAVALAIPARTARIPGGVAELTNVRSNGHELGLMIRGQHRSAPVLLFLAGGPGGSELGAMRRHLPDLEKYYVVATFDQRGTGTSYSQIDPTDTLTVKQAVSDVLNVADYLRGRFHQDNILLVGQSWGSILGVLSVQQAPSKFSGFVGVGQMVSVSVTDRIFYDDTLSWARQRGDDKLVKELEAIGPPPYSRTLDYETALSYEHQVYPYDHSPNDEGEGGFSENFVVPEYSLIDKVHLLAGFLDTFSVLYPQIRDIDFRDSARTLPVPVFFVEGAHEAAGRLQPFNEWYGELQAPHKERVTFATSGHRPLFEQPGEFVAYVSGPVLQTTAP